MPLDLARPGLRIQIAADAGEVVAFAADQLAYYLSLLTGHGPRVGQEPGELELRVTPDAPALRREGAYRIVVSPRGLLIEGGDPLALLHGVYSFLESKGGCRWLAAFEGGEIIPRRETLQVPECDERHAPAFTHRAFTNFPDIDQRTVEMVDWMCKNRFNRFMVFANVEGSLERYRQVLRPHLRLRGMKVALGHHSFRFWLPPGELFASHPEWFSQLEGRRTPEGQLCLSNPEVSERVAARIGEFFDESPEVDLVGLWPNDGYGWCECPECLKLEPQRPSAMVPSQPARTTTYLRFATEVADRLALTHPDRRLSLLAYVNYADPPDSLPPFPPLQSAFCEGEGGRGVRPNLALCFAPMHRCFKHPLDAPPHCTQPNARYADLFRRWRELVPGELYLFCYLMLIDTCSLPYPITRMLGPNFRWVAEHGGDGYVMEFKPEEWGPFGVNAHLIGRLSWEPNLDVAAWLRGYHADLYGPAAEEMSAFWERLLDDFVEPGPCVYHYDLTYTRQATHELLQPALAHLGRARLMAATGELRHWEAVERAQVGVELLLRMGEWQRGVAAADRAAGPPREVLVQRAQALGESLAAWARAHGSTGALFAPRIEMMVQETGRTHPR